MIYILFAMALFPELYSPSIPLERIKDILTWKIHVLDSSIQTLIIQIIEISGSEIPNNHINDIHVLLALYVTHFHVIFLWGLG